MKINLNHLFKLLTVLMATFTINPLLSQDLQALKPDSTIVQAMQKLEFLAGNWEGKAMMTNRNGRFEITQTEKAEFRLGGVVLEIHGMGFSGDSPEPVFEALGIILYDARTNKHVFRAIHKTGQFIDTEIEWLGPKKFQWIIDVKSGKRRHIMELINGQWVEYGEMLTPKGAWFKFFEMKLDRKE
ncbi:MAG: hypothetical protein H6696_12510 [Deferribacteres bacterium]|nr:hypothetical protein [candidate division KSB1 bacterium]MCB9502749.1 hypothetical protein [Deferribacteres bacterium]